MKILALSVILTISSYAIGQTSINYEDYWLKNFAQAKDSATKYKKNILISFSGSDWCKPCIKLRTQILDTQEFIDFASQACVLVHADFPYHKPISKEQRQLNEALAERFNKEGSFPKIVIVNTSDSVLFTCGYKDLTTTQYIDMLKKHIYSVK